MLRSFDNGVFLHFLSGILVLVTDVESTNGSSLLVLIISDDFRGFLMSLDGGGSNFSSVPFLQFLEVLC